MVTSCGSPCYAAPELVISNGVYAGTAVDVWSCGVILFAMVAGYLPFDDDPDNPDGNNINKLYKYILATKLEYPLHVGPLVQNLLMKILVANPAERVKLRDIRRHKWLERYRESFKEFDLFDEMQNEKSIRTQEFSLPNRENSQKDRIDGCEKTKPSVFGGEIESQFTYKKLDHAEAELFLQNTKQVEEKNKIKASSGNRGSASSKMLQKDVSNRNSDSDVNQEQRPLTRREDSAISELSFRDSRRSNIRDSGLEYSIGKGNVLLNREHEQLGVLVGNGISSNLAHKSKSKGKKTKASNSNILCMSQKPEFLKRMSYYKESPNPKLVTSTPPNMVMMCLLSVAGRFGYLVEVTSKDEKNRIFSQMTKRASGTNLIDQFSVRINCPVLGDVGGTAKTNSSEFEHKQSESEELTREAQNIIKEIIDEHRSLDRKIKQRLGIFMERRKKKVLTTCNNWLQKKEKSGLWRGREVLEIQRGM
ncbi:Serine/threonine-protein kinase KIN4 [Zancudomyces culisetae]|uniref:non-specific serine/threonine protein kinase n=1 Tax=Zancudomyces culisetae TaxID=1213189 RepID=A0A1R1PP91_ZANCU|nr:Serine/threonine-protein kinase KIN4 [Zancudomyces culisetae]|eukprot:OMH82787.1 Serine/threonine-protein kinase KIN4 [Zancudomyces culisetae]